MSPVVDRPQFRSRDIDECETFCQKRGTQLIQDWDCNYMPEV